MILISSIQTKGANSYVGEAFRLPFFTPPTGVPSWMIGLPDTSVYKQGQHILT